MKNIKQLVGTAVGVAAIAFTSVLGASSATAVEEPQAAAEVAATKASSDMGPAIVDECPAARFCFYIFQNYYIPPSGNPYGYRLAYASAGRASFAGQPAAGGGTFVSNVESVDNNTGLRICLYNSGSSLIAGIPAGQERYTLGSVNNLAAGWRAVASTVCPPNYVDD